MVSEGVLGIFPGCNNHLKASCCQCMYSRCFWRQLGDSQTWGYTKYRQDKEYNEEWAVITVSIKSH